MTTLIENLAASFALIPAVTAMFFKMICLSGSCAIASLAALIHTNQEIVENASQPLILALDASGAVLVTLVCSMYLCVQRSLIGIIRVLWLVTLVTSSSAYGFFQKMAPSVSFIPNDLTIVALAVSGILLFGSCIYSQIFARPTLHNRDRRAIGVEVLFVCGAMVLRFDDDIHSVINYHVGWSTWYICSSLGALFTIFLVHRWRNQEENESRGRDLRVDL